MSGGMMKVDAGGIDILISDMKAGCDKLSTRLDDMDKDLQKYISQWEGGAQKAYHVAQTQWKQEITDLKELLEDVRKAVHESKENYLAGELKNEQSWA